jgi:hypothetical protein
MTFVITMPVLRLFGNHLINPSSTIGGDVGDVQRYAARDFINNSDKKITMVPTHPAIAAMTPRRIRKCGLDSTSRRHLKPEKSNAPE